MSGWADYGFPDLKMVTPKTAFTGIIKALYERALWSYLEHPEERVISRLQSGKEPDLPYPLDPIYYYGTKTYETDHNIFSGTTWFSFLADFMNDLNNVSDSWCTEDSTPDNVVPVRNSDWYFTAQKEIFPLVQKFPSDLLKRIYDHINQLYRMRIGYGYGNATTDNVEFKKVLLKRYVSTDQGIRDGMTAEEMLSRLRALPFAETIDTNYCYPVELSWQKLKYYGGNGNGYYTNSLPAVARSDVNLYFSNFSEAQDVILRTMFRHTFPKNVTFEFYVKTSKATFTSPFNFWPQFPVGDGSTWTKKVYPNIAPGQVVDPLADYVLPTDFSSSSGDGRNYDNFIEWTIFLNLKCENGLEFVAPEPEEETEEE